MAKEMVRDAKYIFHLEADASSMDYTHQSRNSAYPGITGDRVCMRLGHRAHAEAAVSRTGTEKDFTLRPQLHDTGFVSHLITFDTR